MRAGHDHRESRPRPPREPATALMRAGHDRRPHALRRRGAAADQPMCRSLPIAVSRLGIEPVRRCDRQRRCSSRRQRCSATALHVACLAVMPREPVSLTMANFEHVRLAGSDDSRVHSPPVSRSAVRSTGHSEILPSPIRRSPGNAVDALDTTRNNETDLRAALEISGYHLHSRSILPFDVAQKIA